MRTRAVVVARPALLLVLAVLGGVVALAAATGTAFAHAELVSSDPAADSQVDRLPDVAKLTFTEAVGQPAALSVTGPDGQEIATGEPDTVDTVLSRPLDTAAATTPGTYTMSYQVTSADGHPVSGTVTFELTTGAEATPPAPTGADDSSAGVSTAVVVALLAALVVALAAVVLGIRRLVGREPGA